MKIGLILTKKAIDRNQPWNDTLTELLDKSKVALKTVLWGNDNGYSHRTVELDADLRTEENSIWNEISSGWLRKMEMAEKSMMVRQISSWRK